jgi:hypothetical protein
MKAEHQQYVHTIENQEEKMREQTKEKHLALRELDGVKWKLDKLEAKDTEWCVVAELSIVLRVLRAIL